MLSTRMQAQHFVLSAYGPDDQPIVSTSSAGTGLNLTIPWAGGLNGPQLALLDLVGDQRPELIVYDRLANMTTVYERNAMNLYWQPVFAGARYLPPINEWFRLGDWDADGRLDLLTNSSVSQVGMALYTNKRQGRGPQQWQLVTDTLHYLNQNNLRGQVLFNPADMPAFGDFDNDGDADLLLMQFGLSTLFLLKNQAVESGQTGYPQFQEVSRCAGQIATSNVCGQYSSAVCRYGPDQPGLPTAPTHLGASINYFDLNQDGIPDLLHGDIGCPLNYYFPNLGTAMAPRFSTTPITIPQGFTQSPGISTFPSSFKLDADQDGIDDLLISSNERDFTAISLTHSLHFYKGGMVGGQKQHVLMTNRFLQDSMLDFGGSVSPLLADLNADGAEELLVGTYGELYNQTRNGQIVFFDNVRRSGRPYFALRDSNYLNISSLGLMALKLAVGDLNNDGSPDLIVNGQIRGTSRGQLIVFYNQAAAGMPAQYALGNRQTFNIQNNLAESVATLDLNQDGKTDLLMGRFDGTLTVLLNSGGPGTFSYTQLDDVGRLNPGQNSYNLRIAIGDLNQDGEPDLIGSNSLGRPVVWASIRQWWQGVAPSPHYHIFADSTRQAFSWSVSNDNQLAVGHLDGDQVPDLLIGTAAGGFFSLKNVRQTLVQIAEPIKSLGWQIYPNPATEREVFVTGQMPVLLTDLQGRSQSVEVVERSTGLYSMNLQHLPAGTYWVKTVGGQVKKLVLNP